MRLKEIKPGMVIHCKTEEEAKELMLHLESKGLTWGNGESPTCNNRFSILGEFTCYAIHECHLTFDCYSHFESSNSKITEFSDLIIPELSAKEVLETIYEICDNHKCTGCPLKNCCPTSSKGTNYSDTIEICAKWREEHLKEEKKELKTEWVYVVRIIKVHGNGKKECVHEVDFTKNEQTGEYQLLGDFVTEQLKKYCSEHKGNFFAVYEAICRIKE